VDLLQGGQGMFGIALGRVWRELEGKLSELQGEPLTEQARIAMEAYPRDELAQRRRQRRTG
jgi:hypothetical protein